MAIEFMEAAKGSEGPFVAMRDWAEKSVSKAVLGGTLTSQADGKSSTNALGKVHNEVRHDLMMSDGVQLGSTLTRDLVYALLALNQGGVADRRRLPTFKFMFDETEDLGVLGEALPKLVGIGMRIPSEWAHQRAGIPLAEEGAAILQIPPTPPLTKGGSVAGEIPAASAALKGGLPETIDNPTATLEDGLVAATASHWDTMLATVKQRVDAAESLTTLQQALTAEYGNLSSDELVRVMAAGFALAELKGMADVSDGQ